MFTVLAHISLCICIRCWHVLESVDRLGIGSVRRTVAQWRGSEIGATVGTTHDNGSYRVSKQAVTYIHCMSQILQVIDCTQQTSSTVIMSDLRPVVLVVNSVLIVLSLAAISCRIGRRIFLVRSFGWHDGELLYNTDSRHSRGILTD